MHTSRVNHVQFKQSCRPRGKLHPEEEDPWPSLFLRRPLKIVPRSRFFFNQDGCHKIKTIVTSQGAAMAARGGPLVIFHLENHLQAIISSYLQVCFNMSYFTNTVSVVAYIHICRLLQLQYLQTTHLKINILNTFYTLLLFYKIENNIDFRVKVLHET